MSARPPTGVPGRVRAGQVVDADVAVVGAGVAGLVCALDLREERPGARIVVIDKGPMGSSGSTPLAQGGMAAALGPEDSPRLHAEDTMRAGDGLCDRHAVAVLAVEAPDRVVDLERRGVRFDRTPSGQRHLAREGGQTVPRCVHTRDATGAEIFRALRAAASAGEGEARPAITRLQGTACGIATVPEQRAGRRACGVWALLDETGATPAGPEQEGGLALVRAPYVVLATGGCGGLYAATTNRGGATGDGAALAYDAGAALVDLEFVQFHPTGLRTDGVGSSRLLLTEALRGAGAVLLDRDGRRFMPAHHPDAELAPRHVVTRAILSQSGGAWLDATAIGADRLAAEFPTVVAGARAEGFDLAREPVPVEPTQHYLIGGVATDLQGRSSLPGLLAVGEVACTGVHGANRMAGNSLAQACVYGHRAARWLAAALEDAPPVADDPPPPAFAPGTGEDAAAARDELRRAMSAGAGPVRSQASLLEADTVLEAIEARAGQPAASAAAVELAHACRLGRLIVRSARLRGESRGVHWREDAPERSRAWEGVRLRVQGETPRDVAAVL